MHGTYKATVGFCTKSCLPPFPPINVDLEGLYYMNSNVTSTLQRKIEWEKRRAY